MFLEKWVYFNYVYSPESLFMSGLAHAPLPTFLFGTNDIRERECARIGRGAGFFLFIDYLDID